MLDTAVDSFATPAGPMTVAVDGAGRLVRASFGLTITPSGDTSRCSAARIQILEYFEGRRRTFDLELAPHGTDFQRRVWDALLRIPWGHTWSYRELAEQIDNPGAIRAVGQANGANPIPLVIPCHRVVAADGTIGGYSAGLDRKRMLLALEGRTLF